MNTLTPRFNSFTLPKLNTNLLSVLSLIVFGTMAFLAVLAIASNDCTAEAQRYMNAQNAYNQANQTYEDAQTTLLEALKTKNPELIKAATEWVEECRIAKEKAEKERDNASEALRNCLNGSSSGGCGSGGCG